MIETAYPLHDGPISVFHRQKYSNQRQFLLQHWAHISSWYKEVPLDLVKNYFGTEIAFYFAWLEFFNFMLLPVGILGLLVTVANIIIMKFLYIWELEMFCEDDNTRVCPTCETPGLCSFRRLSSFCERVRQSYLFDNHLTVAFAICMSFWATAFLNMWKRRSSTLALKWDVKYEEEESIRPEYQKKATQKRKNIITGEEELFVSRTERALCITFSCIAIFLAVLLAIFLVLVLIIVTMEISTAFVRWHKTKPHASILTMTASSILMVIVMKLFGMFFYGKLCMKLTKFENPRTASEFDKSILYKKFVLAFSNNYATLCYNAFFKGNVYQYPKNLGKSIVTKYIRDTCQPLNCVPNLGIQLGFILLLKKMVANLIVLIRPPLAKVIKMICRRRKIIEERGIPQYEEEYLLEPVGKYDLMGEFSEMIIEFGLVTFFVAAFPLAPLFALINNVSEHRLDAFKFVTRYRRPVPRKAAGIGSWNGILLGMTYFSMVTNAFVVAFTSDFVPKEVHRYTHDYNMTQYVNSTLTIFATKDNALYADLNPPETCVFRALRYPHWHEKKYEKTRQYWILMTWRLVSVFIFEHIVFLLNGILVRAIPTVSQSVKEQMNFDNKMTREAEMNFSDKEKQKLEAIGIRNRQNLVRAGPVTGIL